MSQDEENDNDKIENKKHQKEKWPVTTSLVLARNYLLMCFLGGGGDKL